jgi:hypothetical protein
MCYNILLEESKSGGLSRWSKCNATFRSCRLAEDSAVIKCACGVDKDLLGNCLEMTQKYDMKELISFSKS